MKLPGRRRGHEITLGDGDGVEHDQGINVPGHSKATCLTCDTLNSTLRDVNVEWTRSGGGTTDDLYWGKRTRSLSHIRKKKMVINFKVKHFDKVQVLNPSFCSIGGLVG